MQKGKEKTMTKQTFRRRSAAVARYSPEGALQVGEAAGRRASI
jgi:hypothetical protein